MIGTMTVGSCPSCRLDTTAWDTTVGLECEEGGFVCQLKGWLNVHRQPVHLLSPDEVRREVVRRIGNDETRTLFPDNGIGQSVVQDETGYGTACDTVVPLILVRHRSGKLVLLDGYHRAKKALSGPGPIPAIVLSEEQEREAWEDLRRS